jgi:hypothetical protein
MLLEVVFSECGIKRISILIVGISNVQEGGGITGSLHDVRQVGWDRMG